MDALSQGLVLLGVSTGWIEEELRYLGAAWQQRGPMLDEAIRDVRLFRDERIDEINRQMRLFAKEVLPSFVG